MSIKLGGNSPKKITMRTASILPAEYQEVEWIKSSGRCVIATGYSPTGTYFGVDLKMKYNSVSAELGGTPFVYGYTQSNFCFLTRNGNSPYYWEFGNGGTAKVTSVVVQSNTDYTIKVVADNGTQTIDINGTTETGTCGSTLTTGNIPIFCRYANNRYEYFATDMTLYYFKMYSAANTLVRNFVPCYRIADGVIGMYDIVNDVFYTNSGTGTFTKGNDVTQVEKEIKRITIRPNGTEKQIRPAGWQPGANTIAYYPLTSVTTVNDMKGSGTLYNLTNVGNTSFGINAGVDCARFYGNSSTGLYNTSLSFGAYPTQTVLGWMYITGGGTSNWFQTIYRIGNENNGQMGTWYNNNEPNTGGPALAISQWEYLKESMKAGGLLNNRYLLVNVTNGTSSTQYINGNAYQTYTNTLSKTQTGIYIGKDSGTANFLKGYLSELIVENKARTATEISNYYNSTKGNYGL